jgi:hypothetical protein
MPNRRSLMISMLAAKRAPVCRGCLCEKSWPQVEQGAQSGPHDLCHSGLSEPSLFIFMGLNRKVIPRIAPNGKMSTFSADCATGLSDNERFAEASKRTKNSPNSRGKRSNQRAEFAVAWYGIPCPASHIADFRRRFSLRRRSSWPRSPRARPSSTCAAN